MLMDNEWISDMWGDACQQAAEEMQIGVAILPESCSWTMEQALDEVFFPD